MNCPYCSSTARSNAGMIAHIRVRHPAQYTGKLATSLPEGFTLGKATRKSARHKSTDKPKKQPISRAQVNFCPECGCNVKAIAITLGVMNGGAK